MKKTLLFTLSCCLLLACKTENSAENNSSEITKSNPILEKWNTPFGLPPFNKIKSEDYLPAFKIAIVVKRLPKTRSGKILRGTVRKIADNEPYNVPATIMLITQLHSNNIIRPVSCPRLTSNSTLPLE